MVPLLSTATFLTINLFSTTNPCRSTNVGMATSNFLRLHLTPVFLSFIFWIFAERCNLHNFAHYVRHRTVLDYIIVYDETIAGNIGEHILLAIKFYAYIHGSWRIRFIISNQWPQKILWWTRARWTAFRSWFHNALWKCAYISNRTTYIFLPKSRFKSSYG